MDQGVPASQTARGPCALQERVIPIGGGLVVGVDVPSASGCQQCAYTKVRFRKIRVVSHKTILVAEMAMRHMHDFSFTTGKLRP